MEVAHWMTKNPIVAESKDSLATVQRKMDKGSFHRVPIVDDGKLVGIVSDRDLHEHMGSLSNVRVNGAMTKPVISVTPETMLEQAANLLVRHRIGGMPVVEQGNVVGIITASDLLHAFAEVLGGTQAGVSRIDLALDKDASELSMVAQLIAQENGEILGMGTYRNDGPESGRAVTYVRLRTADANRVARMLTEKNYNVLAIHS